MNVQFSTQNNILLISKNTGPVDQSWRKKEKMNRNLRYLERYFKTHKLLEPYEYLQYSTKIHKDLRIGYIEYIAKVKNRLPWNYYIHLKIVY